MGDLNAQPKSKPLTLLEERFERNSVKDNFTYPNKNPRKEIDYVMVAKHTRFKWIDYRVIEGIHASDHLPLFVELELVKDE